MAPPHKVPVIIGVGDFTNRSTQIEDAKEPMQLMVEAIHNAIRDTSLSPDRQTELQNHIDSVKVVATWSWPYEDLPGLIGAKLGTTLKSKELSDHGGHSPGLMLHKACVDIAHGSSDIAVVTGGESLGSLVSLLKAGIQDPQGWTARPEGQESFLEQMITGSYRAKTIGTKHGVSQPIHVYPMYENGLRAHTKQTYQENSIESAKLYAAFSEIASKHHAAWNYGKPPTSAEEILHAEGKNRMICTPYPLLMNAFNNVNMSSASLLTSTDVAEKLGIPKSHWVYPTGGAGFEESEEYWLRPTYHTCPSIEKAIDTALQLAGLGKDQIDVLDIYSCFPIVPKLACRHMGISVTEPTKPISLLGGLTSFGGAGNNYSGNALVEMTRELRKGNKKNGLVLANGGFLTHQHAVVLSSIPPQRFGFPLDQAHHDAVGMEDIPFQERAEGEAIIETYTVEFDRKGRPSRGHVVGRLLKDNHRFIANPGDESTLAQLTNIFSLSFPAPHVLLVTINREEARNAIPIAGHAEGDAIFTWFDEEPSLRVAVITGSGNKAFCAGADLIEQSIRAASKEELPKTELFPPSGFAGLTRRVGKKPVIVAVNGFALGGGFEICLNSDVVVAAPNAKFGLTEVSVGLYAAAGGLSRIARSAGLQVASEVALTGRHITPDEAKQWGLINRIAKSQESVVAEALDIARLIASRSPDAVIVSRAGVREAFETASMERASQITDQRYRADLFKGENYKIGVTAFAERKVPQWVPSKL
ncbi:thiolase [Paecilomyces variotii No. 5]|uniref:Thiolase n=1 Tax=Byssochlamys spectabilis (strain No. 5 / NBRC 109023) TaxID=1356009 RepID=V5FCW9_BYSSN|nr:thiolase [Paecilomyces variotii No. 5]